MIPSQHLILELLQLPLAGVDLSKTNLDGKNVAPYITGKTNKTPHKELFWRIGRNYKENSGVLREGDYKLIIKNDNIQLFNLKDDLSETQDLSKVQPIIAQKMLSRWQTLNQSSKPALWQPLGKNEEPKDEYQYKNYEWLKGSPHYRASLKKD